VLDDFLDFRLEKYDMLEEEEALNIEVKDQEQMETLHR
jgi:hypothetical protein